MRLRRPPPVLPAGAGVPARLARCFVEDWARPEEFMIDQLAPGTWEPGLTAWRRWSRARREWFNEHEIPHSERAALIPSRRPEFRDYRAFVAAVRRGRRDDGNAVPHRTVRAMPDERERYSERERRLYHSPRCVRCGGPARQRWIDVSDAADPADERWWTPGTVECLTPPCS